MTYHNPHCDNCARCAVHTKTEWCALSGDTLGLFSAAKTTRIYHGGDTLYMEGAPNRGVYCLGAGMVGIRKSDADGQSLMLRLAKPGTTLGYRAFLSDEEHETTAEALGSCRVCHIDHTVLQDLLAQHPELGMQFLKHASRDLKCADERALQATNFSVRSRLLHALLALRNESDAGAELEEMSFTLPLTRQDLAALVGIRPETLSRSIRQLADENLAYFTGRTVHMPNPNALYQEVVGYS